jgi:hypothetical protein
VVLSIRSRPVVGNVLAPLLWTTVVDGLDGLVLLVRGELSVTTTPALDSLLEMFHHGRERVLSIDLRDADVRPSALERLAARWGAAPGPVSGVYRLDPALTPLR